VAEAVIAFAIDFRSAALSPSGSLRYSYWSGALVSHCKEADRVIDFSRTDDGDLSAYIAMIQLNKKWKAKLDKWTNQQPRRQSQSIVVPGYSSLG
jgi:hypothetical protein